MARTRAARKPADAGPEGNGPSSLLNDLLPLFEPSEHELHLNASVLEVVDPVRLLELAADATLRPYLLCRLSPTVALVDPGRAGDLAEALRRRGHTPKILKS